LEWVPETPSRSGAVHGLPIGLAAQRLAESSGRERNRGEGPGCRRFDEELATLNEIGRYRAMRIDPATRAILVNEAKRQVANAMCETSESE
jgi:hypothetical protein